MNCRYCGEQAGFLRREHEACRNRHRSALSGSRLQQARERLVKAAVIRSLLQGENPASRQQVIAGAHPPGRAPSPP